MKNDDNRAAVVCILWSISFISGMFIAAIQGARPFGIMLMVVSTIILALYLRWDDRLEKEEKRRHRYERDCAYREKEVRK